MFSQMLCARALGVLAAALSGASLALAQPGAPLDNCDGVDGNIAPSTLYLFDVAGATQDGASSCMTVATPDLWFKHTPAITGYMVVETCGTSLLVSTTPLVYSGYVVSAHSGCPGNSGSTMLACTTAFQPNSLGCNRLPTVQTVGLTRRLQVPVTAGVPVWVRIAGDTDGFPPSGRLQVTDVPRASNDSCATPLDIAPGTTVVYDTGSGTYDPAEGFVTGSTTTNILSCVAGTHTPAPSINAPDLWYRYTPTANGNVSIVMHDVTSQVAPVLSVHSGCNALSLACARANLNVYGATLTVPVTAGSPILIRVAASASGYTFSGDLSVSFSIPPPPNDFCSNATPITLGAPDFAALVSYDTSGATASAGSVADPSFATPCTIITPSSSFDVWYKYTPAASGTVIFSSCLGNPAIGIDAGATFPVQLSAYSDCAGSNPICGTDVVCITPTFNGGGSLGWLSAPVTAGVPVYLRICGFGGSKGTGTLLASFQSVPANDLCDNAFNVGTGTFPFSTFSGTQDRTASCNYTGVDTAADVWFRYTPAADGLLRVNTCSETEAERVISTLTAYNTCNGPELIGCDSVDKQDFCFPNVNNSFGSPTRQGVLRLQARAGVPILLRVASAATSPTATIRRGTRGTIHIAQESLGATRWFEGNTPRTVPTPAIPTLPDAGDLPTTAQVIAGRGPLTEILSTTVTADRADLFKIRICDVANFSLTFLNPDPNVPLPILGQLFLFDSQGRGVSFAHVNNFNPIITNQFVTAPGEYYVGVSVRSYMPVDNANDVGDWQDHSIWQYDYFVLGTERAPDGPAASNPVAGWSIALYPNQFGDTDLFGEVTIPAKFTLLLTGTCHVCVADFNQSGGLEVQDIFDFLNAWFAANPRADFNGGGLSVQDIFDYLNAWFAGC
jgi:hypothetical protein